MAEQRYFLIGSYGRTGTQWITEILSGHPDIALTHGPEIQLMPDPSETRAERIARHISPDNPFNKKTPDDVIEEIARQTSKTYVGNIHGIAIIPLLHPPYLTRNTYRFAQIVRHPVYRIDSFIKHYRETAQLVAVRRDDLKQQAVALTEAFPRLAAICADLDLPENIDASLRLFSLYQVSQGDRNTLERRADTYMFERLTADKDYLLSMICHLTDPALPIDTAFEQHLETTAAQDKTGKADRTVSDCLAAWPEWQMEAFAFFFPKQTYRRIYRQFGYGYPLSEHGDEGRPD